MDFEIPAETTRFLADLDAFLAADIKPLEDANPQFFDHRREYARTDWEAGGVPSKPWEELVMEMRQRADRAGFLRYALPRELGGQAGSNLSMAIVREHLAAKGIGLHRVLQDESSVVGNLPMVHMMWDFGTPAQQAEWLEPLITGSRKLAFGLTEPNHGSDATWMESTAYQDGDEWVLNGSKRWSSGLPSATHELIFARTSGEAGDPKGITAFLTPTDAAGFAIEQLWWTLNMPTDHAEISMRDVRVPTNAVLGEVGEGLSLAQHFVHENRIRQAASGVGAAQYCIDEAVKYANVRTTWGKRLSVNQAIQFPLAELHTETEMVRNLVYKTAWELDRNNHMRVTHLVAMANYRANRLACDAADRVMQVHGGIGYSRHLQFEHIYRHHRRYRITEGSEEIQIRKVAANLFGFSRQSPQAPAGTGVSA